MVQPKYSPEESLQRVKLMMGYDMKKTLKENKEVIFEQVDVSGDVRDLKDEISSFNSDEDVIVKIIQKYKSKAEFNALAKAYQDKYQKDFGTAVYEAINTNDPTESKQLQDHLASIGITAKTEPTGDGKGTFKWSFNTGNEVQSKKDGKQEQAPAIPKELLDIEGVKKFQDWLDKNKVGWATGFPGEVLNKASGYGRFGPRTTKAWSSYGPEYLKGGATPSLTPSVKDEFSVQVDADKVDDILNN
jgi:hypothetical protein